MKKHAVLICLFALVSVISPAQPRPYNVAFDLTSADTNDHKTVIRWMNLILQGNPNANLEVVLYGQSLGMLLKDKSVVGESIMSLTAQQKNVSLKACELAMKKQNIDKGQLLPGVQTVPDGIYELITKQAEGWGYIKVAH